MGDNKAAPVTVRLTESRLRNEKNDAVGAQISKHLDAGEVNVILDFSAVEFVDSSFLGMLVVALKRATALEGDIVLCCLQAPVKTIFNLMRLHRIFGIYDTVDEAAAAFN